MTSRSYGGAERAIFTRCHRDVASKNAFLNDFGFGMALLDQPISVLAKTLQEPAIQGAKPFRRQALDVSLMLNASGSNRYCISEKVSYEPNSNFVTSWQSIAK